MSEFTHIRRAKLSRRTGALLALAGLFSACGGGGGGGSTFAVESFSVPNDAVWAINRPIEIVFSEPIDFATVNLTTISIRTLDGVPAIGAFVEDPARPNVVQFIPRCPTRDDFSDAGLTPSPTPQSRVEYTINVTPASGSSPSVRAVSGNVIRQGQPRDFITPLVDEPLDRLFLDVQIGPPQPIVRGLGGTAIDEARATRIQVGADPMNVLYFTNVAGVGVLPGGVELPLNLYSDPESRVCVFVEFNQPVSPRSANISPRRVGLEYDADLDPGIEDWRTVETAVDLTANCVDGGATMSLQPVGILPQGRPLRVRISPEFQDLVGEVNPSNVGSFALMVTSVPNNAPLPTPELAADEVLESFDSSAEVMGSLEDPEAIFDEPSPAAEWGGGKLEAGFSFDGTGGPGGNFDLHIPPGQTIIFNTTSSVFLGGPGGVQVTQQVAVNGVLDVRDLFIPAGSTLLVQGPNPARILATGNVIVDGNLLAEGSSNTGVVTLNTANVPEGGSAGQVGGGRGGKGSFLTTQSTPRGERGFGAFNQAGGGGEGGESAFNPNSTASTARRPGGGGGGSLGPNIVNNTFVTPCRDNNIVGLDAEQGFAGAMGARGALHPGAMPQGGLPGPTPFFDADTDNNFFGTRLTADGRVISGELPKPWAGAGGGGGGDALTGTSFPNPGFNSAADEKGSGGGGGGGSLRILALGDVSIGARGVISVNGGHGGGGENTNGLNRIGGGSGGGSGGHLIIETVSQIDLSQVLGTLPHFGENTGGGNPMPILDVGLLAAGGQGGAGMSNTGGAGNAQSRQFPCRDATPDEPGVCTSGGPGTVTCAGGDGGPGLIQLHVLSLDSGGPGTGDILAPVSGSLFEVGFLAGSTCTGSPVNRNAVKNNGVVKPPPVGSPWATTIQANNTVGWDQMLPSFGPVSRAQSRWISLGSASTQASSAIPEALDFFFDGTDPLTGFVRKTGTQVEELTAVLNGTVASIENGFRTAVLPEATITDDVYQRNASLFTGFTLRLAPLGGGSFDFPVAAATYDSVAGQFAVTVEGTGAVLAGFESAAFVLIPNFFQVSTSGVTGFLPDSTTIQIEFQATEATLTGDPNETAGVPSLWVTDIDDLDGNPDWRFVRFRARFDIDALGNVTLDVQTPRPSLEFLKIPFLF